MTPEMTRKQAASFEACLAEIRKTDESVLDNARNLTRSYALDDNEPDRLNT